jgi:hypothetical protein
MFETNENCIGRAEIQNGEMGGNGKNISPSDIRETTKRLMEYGHMDFTTTNSRIDCIRPVVSGSASRKL